MRHQNITFSIPEDLKATLHARVGKRGMSQFISKAIRKALEDEQLKKERELDAAYEAASRDEDRLEILRDWEALDYFDQADNHEDWSWLKKS